MRVTIISLFFLIPYFTFCQHNSSFEFVASGDYSFRDINYQQSAPFIRDLLKNENGDRASFRSRFGFNYNKRIASSLVLKTGLQLASIVYKSQYPRRMTWGEKIDDYYFYPVNPDKLEGYAASYHHYFLEVPLALRYEIPRNFGKFQAYVEGGIAASYYLGSFYQETRNGKKELYQENFSAINKFQMKGILGVGLNYNLNEKIQLFFQPTFRYNFTPMLNSVMNEKAFSVGFDLGIRMKLN